MSQAFQDLRHSIRPLWKEKPFTFTVLVTLAVCVGANAAIFSVVKTVLLSPLPFPDPDQLVVLYNSYPGAGVPRGSNGATDYFMRRERLTSFSHLAQYQGWGNTVGDPGETTRVQSMRVTASYFPLLGVRPLLGRSFTEEEMDPGNEQVLVLSHAFWQDGLGGDPSVLERELQIDGRPFRIVGVLPADFRLPQNEQPRFYLPIPYSLDSRGIDKLAQQRLSDARAAPAGGHGRARPPRERCAERRTRHRMDGTERGAIARGCRLSHGDRAGSRGPRA